MALQGENHRFLCRLCDFHSDHRRPLLAHIRTAHIPNITCPICGEFFLDEKILESHKNQPHRTKYTCQTCDEKFTKKSLLQSHNRHRHDLVKCSLCPKLLLKSEVKKHLLDFHKSIVPTCGVCGFKGSSQALIVRHQRKVHLKEKNVTCPVCKIQFFGSHELNKHMIRHKAVKIYQCRFCKKSFPRSTTCRTHERIHTGEKNKVCRLCDAAFVQKSSLNYHMLKHHPDHV